MFKAPLTCQLGAGPYLAEAGGTFISSRTTLTVPCHTKTLSVHTNTRIHNHTNKQEGWDRGVFISWRTTQTVPSPTPLYPPLPCIIFLILYFICMFIQRCFKVFYVFVRLYVCMKFYVSMRFSIVLLLSCIGPCISVSVYQCISVSVYQCISVSVYQCMYQFYILYLRNLTDQPCCVWTGGVVIPEQTSRKK